MKTMLERAFEISRCVSFKAGDLGKVLDILKEVSREAYETEREDCARLAEAADDANFVGVTVENKGRCIARMIRARASIPQ